MSYITTNSLEQTYAEAKKFATMFGSTYLIYRPADAMHDHYAIMPKRFFDLIKESPAVKEAGQKILRAMIVMVSPPVV